MACEHNQSMECPCTHSCPNHGKCCACVAAHSRAGEFPACFFSQQAERGGDRSFAALVQDRQT